jgi:superfamily I DNA/RNA helicase/RecB family exonuclease
MTAAEPERLLLSGPPGSGKTTALIERFAAALEAGTDPTRVLMIAATRRAARDARRKLVERIGRSVAALPVTTVHGFAYGVIGRRYADMDYAEPPLVLSAPEQVAWIAGMLEGERRQDWPVFARVMRLRGFARDLASLVLRAQERMLDPESLAAAARRAHGGEEIARFYGRYMDALALGNRIDYAGLLAQTAHVLADGLGDDERFELVLVDDFHETTIAGEAILRELASESRGVWVAGDPTGPVLSSRGAGGEPLDRARETFALSQAETLGSSRRPGVLVAHEYSHPGEEADAIALAALAARVDDDVAWGRMAVLVRRIGTFAITLRHAFARAGVPHIVVDEGALTTTEPAVRPILDVIRCALRPIERDTLLEPLLLSSIGGLDPHGVRRLRREARLRNTTLSALVDEPGELPDDLATAVANVRDCVALAASIAKRPPDEVFYELWTNAQYAASLVDGDDSESRRSLDAVVAFAGDLARYCRTHPGATMEDYLETIDAAQFGADPLTLPEERRPDAVRIMTVHRAQGAEFDTVFVADCIDGQFPSLRLREPIVDLDALVGPARTYGERMRRHLEQERRLFALAISRATRRTILTASRAVTARNPRTPSRYAAAAGTLWMPPTTTRLDAAAATNARVFEAALRHTLADAHATRPARLAALAALAEIGATPAAWWDARDWTGDGGALFPHEIRTSYSRLSSMDNCGLQYLYEVEMGLDPEQSYQMWLGALLHGIIEDVSNGHLPREWDALNEALKKRWDTTVFPNRAVMHRRYLDARQMLWRWLREEDPNPVHSEVAFEFRIDGAVLRGKIDAVFKREDGTVRLVDYKTGRTPPTQDETDDDLQLAAYFLALRRVPELAALGEPSRLELAYLGATEAKQITRRTIIPAKRPSYEADAAARIGDLLARVHDERFDPSPHANCRWCSFKTLCPLWPEGHEVAR